MAGLGLLAKRARGASESGYYQTVLSLSGAGGAVS